MCSTAARMALIKDKSQPLQEVHATQPIFKMDMAITPNPDSTCSIEFTAQMGDEKIHRVLNDLTPKQVVEWLRLNPIKTLVLANMEK
jgi:hypothetical protein